MRRSYFTVGCQSWSTGMGSDAACLLPGRQVGDREKRPGASFCSDSFWAGAITGCFQFWRWAPQRGWWYLSLARKAPGPRAGGADDGLPGEVKARNSFLSWGSNFWTFSSAVDTEVIQGSCEFPRLENRDFRAINVWAHDLSKDCAQQPSDHVFN